MSVGVKELVKRVCRSEGVGQESLWKLVGLMKFSVGESGFG